MAPTITPFLLFLPLISRSVSGNEVIGELTGSNGITGTVSVMREWNKNGLIIEGFSYDGEGGDVYFYVGEIGDPGLENGVYCQYPEGVPGPLEVIPAKLHKVAWYG